MKSILTFLTCLGMSVTLSFGQPSTGLVGYWPFDGNANDETGNGLNGTVSGAQLATDRFGVPNSCYEFDGIDDHIEIADNNLLDFTNSLSLCAWYFPKDSLSGGTLVGKPRADNLGGYNMWAFIPDMGFGLNNSIVNVGARINSMEYYKKWHFIVGTFDGNKLVCYIDGVEIATTNATLTLLNSTQPLYIGSEDNGWRNFGGKIDDVRVYNRALTAEEVNELYNESVCYKTVYQYETVTVYDTTEVEVTIYNHVSVTDTLIIDLSITAIDSLSSDIENTIKIYPNPSKEILTVYAGVNYSEIDDYTIKILNPQGQQVFESRLNQQVFQIDLTPFTSKGIYFVQLFDERGTIIDIRKILIR